MSRRAVTGAVLVLLMLMSVSATASEPAAGEVIIPSARDAALGGRHVAATEGFQTLFTNPAGLAGLEPGFTWSGLTFRFAGPVFSLSSVVIQGVTGGDLATLLGTPAVQSLLSSIYANVSLTGPLYFGYAGGGMGFGVVNDTGLLFRNVGTSGINAAVSERLLVVGGYGFRVPLPETSRSEISAGVTVKGVIRGDVVVSTSLLELPELFESISPALLTGSPFELVSGIGVDVGVRYVWRDLLGVAVTARDLYSPATVVSYDTLGGFLDGTAGAGAPVYEVLPQDLTVGLSFTPTLGAFERYVKDLTVALDYRDALDFWLDPARAENIILKFGLGVEATLLEVLSVRAGFSDALFAAGLGIDMSAVELSAAMYGTELSFEPGLRPVYNLIIGLEFHQ